MARTPLTPLSAAKVRQHREWLGLQQRQAAKAAGWHRCHSWHKLEVRDSDVRISTLVSVARVLKCGIEELLIVAPGKSKSAERYRRR